MIIYYDPENLTHHHVMFAHDPSYDPSSNGDHFLVVEDILPWNRIGLARKNGEVIAYEKSDIGIELLAEQIKLGSDAHFLNVPMGALITVNSDLMGEMSDTTGNLEITPEHSGFYKIRFSLPGFLDEEFDLEVVR